MTQEALRQSAKNKKSTKTKRNSAAEEESTDEQTTSTLIEFPGSARSIPEWRKQLSQRVREVQERKAREAAEELAAAEQAGLVSCALPSGQLELVADLERPVMNPIVSKALERIDRARRSDGPNSQFAATGTAHALAPDLFMNAEPAVETKPKLTVVPAAQPIIPPPTEVVVTAQPEAVLAQTESPTAPRFEITTEPARAERKPVRLISDNDESLSYLETCLQLPALDTDTRTDLASLTRRTIAGIFDLLLIALMISPAAVAIKFSGGNWYDLRVLELMGGITVATMFAYFTITTAMTGRTLGMRMFSLRTIDLHTGMIPTGGQSIKRAIGHVFSLAFFGLGLAYALMDPDRRTIHDRFSHTIVIHG
jgi:uncharacterized RDD family membrane protein YckC